MTIVTSTVSYKLLPIGSIIIFIVVIIIIIIIIIIIVMLLYTDCLGCMGN